MVKLFALLVFCYQIYCRSICFVCILSPYFIGRLWGICPLRIFAECNFSFCFNYCNQFAPQINREAINYLHLNLTRTYILIVRVLRAPEAYFLLLIFPSSKSQKNSFYFSYKPCGNTSTGVSNVSTDSSYLIQVWTLFVSTFCHPLWGGYFLLVAFIPATSLGPLIRAFRADTPCTLPPKL